MRVFLLQPFAFPPQLFHHMEFLKRDGDAINQCLSHHFILDGKAFALFIHGFKDSDDVSGSVPNRQRQQGLRLPLRLCIDAGKKSGVRLHIFDIDQLSGRHTGARNP